VQRAEPALHSVLGWTGLFGAPQTTGLSTFTAGDTIFSGPTDPRARDYVTGRFG
jgi:hypothetical protein